MDSFMPHYAPPVEVCEMPTNYIDGIPVEFPHTAYPCQLTYMQSVLRALKNKENALLESPTGTGKTLSLLCAALAWRTAEMGRRQLMEQTATSKSANYDTIMERAPTNSGDSSAFRTINSASGSTARLQTVLNESLNYAKSNENDPILDDDVSEFIKPPLIIYASRTHSQLSQVIGELRRTTYRPKIAIVGSRDQMCIHPNVKELSSSSAQSAACNRLTRKKSCEFYLKVPEAVNHLKRKEKEQENAALDGGEGCSSDQKIMDMEDLVRFASSHKACPYYTSRELLGEADLVFMPYNYLLDKKTRGSSLLSFKDAIVIFDEAHNVESSCYDAVSCEISSDDLVLSEKELQHCLELIDSPHLFVEFGGVSKDSIVAAQTFLSILKANIVKQIIPPGSNFLSLPGDAIFRVFEESQQANPESGEVEIDGMLGSFEEIVKFYLEDQYNRRSGKRSAFQSLVNALRTIYGMAEKKDEIDGSESASTIYAKLNDKNQKRTDLMAKSKAFYRMVIMEPPVPYGKQLGNTNGPSSSSSPPSSSNGRTMAYWCFNPGVVMKDLISMGVRSIVLTSGTLSPMKSFMQEMQIDFKHVLENDHVIDDDQVFATVVRVGPSGKSLNSSFNQRDSKDYQQELGLSIVNFCRVIPDGVLVFFPSYQVMDSCLTYWQTCKPGGNVQDAKTIFQMIQSIKVPVIEPKNKGELAVAMEKFERIIDDPKEPRGSIFFAVCRGKVSEGLDFSDAKGRAVIITGIPYPPFKDPKIILKKQYLQDQQSTSSNFLSGAEWYNQQASRAVNQALGRVIRHRKDFGAILLCDERFGNPGTIGQLSKWLRGRVSVSASFGEVQGGLARFFKEKPRHIKAEMIQANNYSAAPSTSVASVASVAAQVKKNEIQMQKFKLDKLTPFSVDSSENTSKNNLTEMFKNSQKNETKKFDWFNASQPAAAKPADEKREKAQEYLEMVKGTLSKEDYRKFMGLLKVYRAGQIEIQLLLKDLVELLNSASAQKLLDGFETFVPLKHRNLFEKAKTEAATLANLEEENVEENGKKRKLHSDFVGKKAAISIEPLILQRKLGDVGTWNTRTNLDSGSTVNTHSSLDSVSAGGNSVNNPHNLCAASSTEICPICKDACNDPYKAKCNHVACLECWNAWLGRTLECPLCRQRTRVSQLRK